MRKTGYLLLTGLTLLWASCDDFLDTSSPSKFDDQTVYNSVAYADAEMMGIYSMIADAQMYAQRISMNWCTNSDIEYVGASETSYNENSNRGSSNYYGVPGNTVFNWTNIYKMIERANLGIEGIQNSPLLNSSDASTKNKMQAMLGEALTMRAMGYYELVKHWGDVPFKEEPTSPDLSNVYLGKTDRDTIYEHIINDLLTAEKYVPWLGTSGYGTPERITKGFVKGLLARVCLSRGGYSLRDKPGFPMERGTNWQHYYEIARDQCREIMLNGTHKLNGSYLDIWKKVNALQIETTYNENLYEVALGLGQSGEIGYSIGVRFYANAKYGYGNNANVVNTSAYYFYSFDPDDVRRDITVAYATYSNGNKDLKEVFQGNPLSYNIAKWDQRWMSDKWLQLNLAANGKIGYGINWIVMRYADVLLMFAEAENELNGAPTADAKDALKQVRRRAFASADQTEKVENYVDNLNSRDAFFNAIVNERAWEFGGEALRKFDLVRWNLLSSKIQEQRSVFNQMLDGAPVTVMGNYYDNIPQNLYYKYIGFNPGAPDAVYENLDRDDINFYSNRDDLEALDATGLKAIGYTRVSWLSGAKDADKDAWRERMRVFSSGLDKVNNGTCDNRYLYPISSTAIGDSQGKLTNSYGF